MATPPHGGVDGGGGGGLLRATRVDLPPVLPPSVPPRETTDVAGAAAGAAPPSGVSSGSGGDEGLLRDVLNELDRERERRAELESKFRTLSNALATTMTTTADPDDDEEEVVGGGGGADGNEAAAIAGGEEADPVRRPRKEGNLSSDLLGDAGDGSVSDKISSLIDRVEDLKRRAREKRAGGGRGDGEEENARRSASALTEETERKWRHELTAAKVERDGYLELVEALTEDNDAVSIATEQGRGGGEGGKSTAAGRKGKGGDDDEDEDDKRRKTLPLHVVRLLEVMPWDVRAQSHATATEEVYEWQVYDAKTKSWSENIHSFPRYFRSLPVAAAGGGIGGGATKDRHRRSRRRDRAPPPPRARVVTDSSCARILNVEDGYPLPTEGTWEWLTGWKVDRHGGKAGLDCDPDGWSYASLPKHFLMNAPSEVHDGPGRGVDGEQIDGDTPVRPYRRRGWTRGRALISYPGMSERTRGHLNLLALNAKLRAATTKMSEQLADTKMKLTEAEEAVARARRLTAEKIAEKDAELRAKDRRIRALKAERGKDPGAGDGDDDDGPTTGEVLVDKIRGLPTWVQSEIEARREAAAAAAAAGGGGGGAPPSPSSRGVGKGRGGGGAEDADDVGDDRNEWTADVVDKIKGLPGWVQTEVRARKAAEGGEGGGGGGGDAGATTREGGGGGDEEEEHGESSTPRKGKSDETPAPRDGGGEGEEEEEENQWASDVVDKLKGFPGWVKTEVASRTSEASRDRRTGEDDAAGDGDGDGGVGDKIEGTARETADPPAAGGPSTESAGERGNPRVDDPLPTGWTAPTTLQVEEEEPEATTTRTAVSTETFDWKRIGRGAIMESIKRSGTSYMAARAASSGSLQGSGKGGRRQESGQNAGEERETSDLSESR